MNIVVQEAIVSVVVLGAVAVVVAKIRQAAKPSDPEMPCANCAPGKHKDTMKR